MLRVGLLDWKGGGMQGVPQLGQTRGMPMGCCCVFCRLISSWLLLAMKIMRDDEANE